MNEIFESSQLIQVPPVFEPSHFIFRLSTNLFQIHPRNVFIHGTPPSAYLGDFGCAYHPSLPLPDFQPDPPFSAVEIHMDEKRNDLSALGHLLYFLLHNCHPYAGWRDETVKEYYLR